MSAIITLFLYPLLLSSNKFRGCPIICCVYFLSRIANFTSLPNPSSSPLLFTLGGPNSIHCQIVRLRLHQMLHRASHPIPLYLNLVLFPLSLLLLLPPHRHRC
ncbi:hypothetical protein ABFS83_12G073400 [Erythranthe nasuta]